MRRWASAGILALFGSVLLYADDIPATKPAVAQWTTDFPAALAQAKKENKVVLLNFTGSDWCAACAALHEHIFATPEFAQWAVAKCVLVEVDFPNAKPQPDALKKQNAKLKSDFWVFGFPTVMIVEPDGTMLTYTIGDWNEKPAGWIQEREAGMVATRETNAKAKADKAK